LPDTGGYPANRIGSIGVCTFKRNSNPKLPDVGRHTHRDGAEGSIEDFGPFSV